MKKKKILAMLGRKLLFEIACQLAVFLLITFGDALVRVPTESFPSLIMV